MFKSSLLLAATLVASPALADEVRLTRPIEAGSIAMESLDLVAYFVTLPNDGYAVTATWLGSDDAEASRLTMRLDEGDAVSFSLPGHPETLLTFARDVDSVSVIAAPVVAPTRSASL